MSPFPFSAEQGRVMSSSLRDQLIAAGLVSERQAKQASQQQARQFKTKTPPNAGNRQSAQVAQAAKAARDLELSRRQQEKAERKALRAQIHQMVEQAMLPRIESEDFYSFVDDNKIRRMAVDKPLRDRLMRGELAIVRFKGHYAVVPAEAAARIRERDETAVVRLDKAEASVDPNDPYKDFVVPDDLTW